MSKTDFDKKLIRFIEKLSQIKQNVKKFEKILNSLITKDYNFFLGRYCFTSNDGSQNTFVY